jgi:ABC-2 type transport system permease protein
MDQWLLKILLSLVQPFVKQGVDFERLKIIVQTKLIMDRRRVRTNYKQQKNKEPKNPLLITLVVYSLFGLLMAVMIGFTKPFLLSMIFFHAYLLFMMAMTLITDFSAVLLDTADNQVILPRPVNSKTIFVARLVHILVYLLQFTIALALFPFITIFIVSGMGAGIASFFTILLTVAMAVFITYLLYILILRFSNEQKVKDIIGYFQIFMTLFFSVGFQLFPRLINFEEMMRTFSLHWYSYFLPPVWMALSIDAVQHFNLDRMHVIMMLCALLIPVFTFWLMIKYLAPSFARKLALLQNDRPGTKNNIKHQVNERPFSSFFSALLCKTASEKAGYEIVWKLTGRDKGFKLQFYPSIGYLLVFAFILVFKSGKDFQLTIQSLPGSKLFLWLIYLPVFSVSSSKTIIAFYENFQAAWVYQSTPVKYPGQVISGSIKALLTKFFSPIYLLLYIFSLYTWGYVITDDFVFGFFNNIIIFLSLEQLSRHYLPFSQQQNIKEQSGRFVKVIIQIITIAALVGLHYLALRINGLVMVLVPVAAFIGYLLNKNIKNLRWKDMTV